MVHGCYSNVLDSKVYEYAIDNRIEHCIIPFPRSCGWISFLPPPLNTARLEGCYKSAWVYVWPKLWRSHYLS